MTHSNQPILSVSDLHLRFGNTLQVLHGISLHVRAGEKVALVGESGSGKSVTARLAMGLLQEAYKPDVSGAIRFEGADITRGGAQSRSLRGRRMTMIFQDPTSALNPVLPIRTQFREVVQTAHPKLPTQEIDQRIERALTDVAIPDPVRALDSYPFQLSGGMNQRVMIAMALINRPSLLLADEPGTALDVTVQAQTLRLMRNLTTDHGTAVLFISHNLGVVREFADRVYVIYRGRMVEHGTAEQVFSNPMHPYTQALMDAVPKLLGSGAHERCEESPQPDFTAPLALHPGCAEPEEGN